MGLYFRKSVRVGPLRFNFSKSGIGVSAGIPGFRVGTGPRGHYVHAGAHGVYYRASVPLTPPRRRRTPELPARPSAPDPFIRDRTLGPEVAIESGSVLEMIDSSAPALLNELNDKQSKIALAPWIAGAVLILGLWIGSQSAVFPPIAAITFAGVAWLAAHQWDALRTSTVIMYEIDEASRPEFEALAGDVAALGAARGLWHITTTAAVRDRKYHAGASDVVKRSATSIAHGLPRRVKCNIDVPSIGVGRQRLFFFPDRVLVFDANAVGAVAYDSLMVARDTTRFIEEDAVPSDARVVGRTWRFVNKSGGPDRRFNNNRELPICEYETLHFTSPSGLNELLHLSRVGVGAPFCEAIKRAATRGMVRGGDGSRLDRGTPRSLIYRD